MNTEINTAKKIYKWLWLSPFLTIPTLLYIYEGVDPGFMLICGGTYKNCDYSLTYSISWTSGVLISALWHLLFLSSAWNGEHEFVRWHGRQALLLAGIRTLVALVFAFVIIDSTLAISVLILIWLIGTIWGQNQAAKGDCSLMHWAGHGENLPIKTVAVSTTNIPHDENTTHIEELVDIIRFNRNSEQRQTALAELETLGLVESIN